MSGDVFGCHNEEEGTMLAHGKSKSFIWKDTVLGKGNTYSVLLSRAVADFHKCTLHMNCSPRGHSGLLHLEGWHKTPHMGLEAKPGKDNLVKSNNNRKRPRGGGSKVIREHQGDQVGISSSGAEKSKDGWQGQGSWKDLNQCGVRTAYSNKGSWTTKRLSIYVSIICPSIHQTVYLSIIYNLSYTHLLIPLPIVSLFIQDQLLQKVGA